MPTVIICYFFACFDRINVSFAKFQLQDALTLSDTAYGLGASLFVIGYVIFEVPSSVLFYRFLARKWLARIIISWAVVTAAVVFDQTPWQFDTLRFLIGAGSTTPALYGIAVALLLGAGVVLFLLPPGLRAKEGFA